YLVHQARLKRPGAAGSASAIIAGMTDRTPPRLPLPIRTVSALKTSTSAADDKVLCERCGADMYRMHAVWRCPACGYKTDCCGWGAVDVLESHIRTDREEVREDKARVDAAVAEAL